jgi:predicted Zn-dependent protease with MMP-like domain
MDRPTFERAVQAILTDLPPWVAEEMENVAVIVEDHPDQLQDRDGSGLLGLYEGVPLPERGIDYFGVAPDRITIFYRPHAEMCVSDDEVLVEVRTTVLHEVGHHLGLDDSRLHDLGWS